MGKAAWLIVGGILAAVLLLTLFADQIRAAIEPVIEWIEGQGMWGIVWFIAIYVVLVLLMIPSLPLTLAAGFLYGVAAGSIYVLVAMLVGAAIAFSVARFLLHDRVSGWMEKYPRLERVSRGMGGPEGWKIVMLVKYIPFFPAKVSNYLFGVTAVSMRGFLAGNFLGIAPYTILNVWVGTLAADLANLGEREDRPAWEWALYGVGLLAAIGVVFYVSRLARGAMDKTVERNARSRRGWRRSRPSSGEV